MELMFMTRRFPKRRPVPLPNLVPGILILGAVGVLASVVGLWSFGSTLYSSIIGRREMVKLLEANKDVTHQPLHSHFPLNSLLYEAKKYVVLESSLVTRIDSEAIILFSIALAATAVALMSFILATFGTWTQRLKPLKGCLFTLIAATLLEIITVVKDTSHPTIHFFEGSYCTLAVTFSLLLMSSTWIMVLLHHRRLSYAFGTEKHPQQTPLYDNA